MYKLKDNLDGIRNYDGTPSVTGVLSLIVDPTFDMLKSNPNFEDIMKAAAARGTYVHNYIENCLLNTPTVCDKHMGFIKWFNIYKVLHLDGSDYTVSLEKFFKGDRHAGTVDCILKQHGVTTIIDWKTAKQKPTGLMLEKYKLQLGGYKLLYPDAIQAKIVIFTENDFHIVELGSYELTMYAEKYEELLDHYYYLLNKQQG